MEQSSTAKTSQSNLLNDLKIGNHDRDRQPGNSRFAWTTGMLLIVFCLGLVSYLIKMKSAPMAAASALTETVQEPQQPITNNSNSSPPTSISQTHSILDATGYVSARRQTTVSSQITGKVIEVLIEEGDEVVQGQLLARLDNSVLTAQYNLTKSQLAAAKAELLELEVQESEAQLDLNRIQQLTERSLESQANLDRASLTLEGVKARKIKAIRHIEVAKTRVQLQSQQLAETEIRAPFAGIVINKAAQPGEIISPMSAGGSFTRTGICSIVDMNSLEIEVDVSESNINRIFSGQRVIAKLNSYPSWDIPAEVITIIPAADRSKATVRVRIGFLKKDPRILPDMGVRVSFLEDETTVGEIKPSIKIGE